MARTSRADCRVARDWFNRSVRCLAVAGLVTTSLLALPARSFASTTYTEVTGGQTHSWSNYHNAGGTAGPVYSGQTSVGIDCVEQNGFKVADGNTNWYHIAGSSFYASSDAFYNNGATSGSLNGTPYVDPAVPTCESLSSGASSPPPAPAPAPSPSVTLSQGSPARYGYYYAMSLDNFPANTTEAIGCYDTVSGDFYNFSLTTNGSGHVSTASYCYDADGPDHWVVAGGVESNHVSWGSSPGGAPAPQPTAPVVTPPAPSPVSPPATPERGYVSSSLSDNWSGYEGDSSEVRGVDATWVVPVTVCNASSGYNSASIWSGIDDGPHDLVQAGSSATCDSRHAAPHYYIWWESLIANETFIRSVNPGDTIRSVVTWTPATNHWFIYVYVNGVQRFSKMIYHYGSNNTAECIVEAPLTDQYTVREHGKIKHIKKHLNHTPRIRNSVTGPAHISALADYGTASFSSCTMTSASANNQQIAAGSFNGVTVTKYDMSSSNGLKSVPTDATGDGSSWQVYWRQAV